MFHKTDMRNKGFKTSQRLVPQDIMYGMQMDEVGYRLDDRYHTYHTYDYCTMSYLMIFWSKSGPKVSGTISFDQGLEAKAMRSSMDHDLEQWFSPEWTFILPESLYRKLTKRDIRHLDPWELQVALDEIYARRGMRFLDAYTAAYFIQQSWYNGIIDEDVFDDNILSDVERYNIAFLERHMTPLFLLLKM